MQIIDCKYRLGSTCEVANQITGATVYVNNQTCAACIANEDPKTKNKITCGVAIAYFLRHEMDVPGDVLVTAGVEAPPAEGPGTELKKLLAWFWSPQKKKCRCLTRIQKMNKWGPDKCEARMDTILRWLKHSAAIAKVPYFAPAVRIVVRKAISRSRLP